MLIGLHLTWPLCKCVLAEKKVETAAFPWTQQAEGADSPGPWKLRLQQPQQTLRWLASYHAQL